jgi:sugar lactone lactonase YvrE
VKKVNDRRAASVILPTLLALASGSVPASAGDLSGRVLNGSTPLASLEVTLFASDPAHPNRCADVLGSDTTAGDGAFEISYALPSDPGSVMYVIADASRRGESRAPVGCRRFDGPVVLASVLGAAGAPVPGEVIVNGRTTVAAAYCLAQFIDGSKIAGKSIGFQNAAGMTGNLADEASGEVASVLDNPPNGAQTETLGSFNSLANLVAACVASRPACRAFFELARPPRGPKPPDTLQALVNLARHPARSTEVVNGIFALSKSPPAPYQPARPPNSPPAAWTLALRFVGDGVSMDGPGNFAIDEEGTLWVPNNYTYSPDPNGTVCGGKLLLRFTPTGRYVSGSPYGGGGLDGAGFGVTLDPSGDVWTGNFGFSSPGCPSPPPHNAVSRFRPDGTPVPGAENGYTAGGIDWPQGTISDREGNIWIANCGNGVVTQYPGGDPTAALEFQPDPSCTGVAECSRPFDIAVNKKGWAFVTLNEKNSVAVLKPDGTPIPQSPIDAPGLFDQPMGIAADSHGNMWVANSASLRVPCPNGFLTPQATDGTITMVRHDGKATMGPFSGGGLTIPWGIAVDGDDNVWVANFYAQRLSHFCGRDPGKCPPGAGTGSPISPSAGYAFDGFTRNTGVAIDRSGNVWVANNWKNEPNPVGNPGGYEIVAFVGLAPPIATPLIGPPRKP